MISWATTADNKQFHIDFEDLSNHRFCFQMKLVQSRKITHKKNNNINETINYISGGVGLYTE